MVAGYCSAVPPTSRSSRSVGATVVPLVVLLAWAASQIGTGTQAADVARWVFAVLVGWWLPGAALVRSCRAGASPARDDLAWGAVAGVPVALAGWVAWQLVGLPPLAWGPLVVGLLVALPGTRRRVLAAPAPGDGLPSALVLGACLLVVVAWSTGEYLRWVPADPGAGHVYYPDLLFQLALVGEAGHSLPPGNPTVDGEPLGYHWFTHAVAAQTAAAAGVEPAVATLRLLPSTLVVLTTVTLAGVTRSLSGRVWAGPVAAVLYGVVGELGGTSWRATPHPIPMVHTHWWASLTQSAADLVTVGLAGLLAGHLQRGDRRLPWALALPLAVTAAGTKASVLPVLVCGLLLAATVALVQRRGSDAARSGAFAAGLVLVLGVATVVLYGGQSYGTVVAPFVGAHFLASLLVPGLAEQLDAPVALATRVPGVAVAGLTAWWLFSSLVRWLGVMWLAIHRPRLPATWFLLGCCVAGVTATLLLRHPGSSEIYFLRTAFPVGTIGSAWGLVELVAARRLAVPGRRPWRLAVLSGAVAAVAAFVLAEAVAGDASPLTRWQARYGGPPTGSQLDPAAQVMAWVGAVVAIVILAVVVPVAVAFVRSRLGDRRPTRSWAVPLLVSAVLGAGVPSTTGWVVGTSEPAIVERLDELPENSPEAVSADHVAAARWVRDHSSPRDVVATNRWCVDAYRGPDGEVLPCNATSFWVPAFTERPALVTGWAYAGRTLEASTASGVAYNRTPFWDPALLALQEKAFADPDTQTLDRLRALGVRYLLVDRRAGSVAPALARLADLRVDNRDAQVYELPDPGDRQAPIA